MFSFIWESFLNKTVKFILAAVGLIAIAAAAWLVATKPAPDTTDELQSQVDEVLDARPTGDKFTATGSTETKPTLRNRANK